MLSYEKLSDVPGYGNYYVGFIDILGFKELVNRCFGGDDGRLHTTLCKVFEDLPHYFKGEPSSFYESYESGEPMPKTGTLWMSPYIDEIFDLSFFFSDSIILCTKKSNNIDDDVKRLVTLCSIMSRYVKLLLLNPIDGRTFAVKLRGAIASGPAVIFPATKTFYGKSINDAYELAESQNWVGAALHDSVEINALGGEYLQSLVGFDKPLYRYSSIPIDKQREKYDSRIRYALNWVRYHPAGKDWFPHIAKNKPLGRDIGHHLTTMKWNELVEKKNNTIRFAMSVCDEYANAKEYQDPYSKGGSHYSEGSYDMSELFKIERSD